MGLWMLDAGCSMLDADWLSAIDNGAELHFKLARNYAGGFHSLGQPRRPMIHNRHLPLWLHRVCNGLFGAALLVGMGSIWLDEPADSWRHLVSRCLIWGSIPAGIILALLAHRFSLVQGVGGGDGYDELHDTDKTQPS